MNDELVSTEINPTVTFDEDIESIELRLVLTDDTSGCVSDTIKSLRVNGFSYDIEFPNVFSPNNDKVNDYFNYILPSGVDKENVEVIEFKVYNRWGNLIYDNENPSNGWDGKHRGTPAPSDVYAYYLEVIVSNCVRESSKGNVTIVR